jgi:hypothetical protein
MLDSGMLKRMLAVGSSAFACALLMGACIDEHCNSEPDLYDAHVDAKTVPGATCTVTLSGAHGEATYEFPALPQCDQAELQPLCTPSDGSPAPDFCKVRACVLELHFSEARGAALLDYLGDAEFRLTATCDGTELETRKGTLQRTCLY